jgi:hypothetical protein
VPRAIRGEDGQTIAAASDAASNAAGRDRAYRHLRKQHELPAWVIGCALLVPLSMVGAWLRRLGLNRRPTAPPVAVGWEYVHVAVDDSRVAFCRSLG